jgi:hypothetical protein
MPTDTSSAAPKMTYPQTCEIVQDLLLHSRYFRGLIAARGIPDMLPQMLVDHTSVHPKNYDGLAKVFREIALNLEEQWYRATEGTTDQSIS